jgi:dipeptidyl aminopeptidase/acylaminoacyl peptidase
VGEGLFALRFDVDRGEVSGAPQSIIGGLQRSGNPTVNGAAANYDVSSSGTLVYLGPGTITNFVSGDGALAPLRTLAWVDRSGREESLAVQPLGYVYPRLSPDGARMAVSIQGRAENGGIWIWDFRRQTMTRFTISMQNETAPVWSPNGRRLAWASQRAGGPLNVYWQASDGSGTIERLTESSINHQRPSSFTPDAQHLLLAEGPPGASSQDLGMVSLSGNPRLTWLVKTTSSELGGRFRRMGAGSHTSRMNLEGTRFTFDRFRLWTRGDGRSRPVEGRSPYGRGVAASCSTWRLTIRSSAYLWTPLKAARALLSARQRR